MDGPWSDYGSGDTATDTAPADEQGPWTQFEPGVAAPVQAPDLSKIKLSAYDQATVDRGGIKPPSGMESGTELLTAVGSSPVGRAAISGAEAVGGQISDTGKWLGDAYLAMDSGRNPMAGIETLTQPVARAAGYQLGETGRALWRPVGELAGESDWDALSEQYPKLMALPKVVKGMVESAPKMAAQTLLGPEIGPAVWGLTDEGFDAKTAATMYALPWVKNYTGAIAENVASKMGIQNELAKQVVNRVAGGTAMAGLLTADQIDELRKLSPEERSKKAPETIGNALAMFAMGTLERGQMPEKPAKITPMTGEALDMPEGSAVPPKVPFNLPDAAAPEPPVVPPKAEITATPVPTLQYGKAETPAVAPAAVQEPHTLESVGKMTPTEFFEASSQWSKDSMAGKGMGPQRMAEAAARANPDLEAWQKAAQDAAEEFQKAKAEVKLQPDTMMARQKELMGMAQRAQFYGEGIKEINKAKPTAAPTAPPAEPTPPPAAAPVKAADPNVKAQAAVNRVVTTEGVTSGKEAKSTWLDELNKAIADAPSEDKFPGVKAERANMAKSRYLPDKALWAKAKEEIGTVTIDIPGDGKTTILNTKEALQAVFDKAKRISTKSNDPTKIKRAGVSDEDKAWIQEQLSKPGTTPEPKPAAPEKGMAGPGTPSAAQGPDVGGGFQNQSGADIYGIAQRVRQQRAKSGQVAPIPTGQGVAAGDAVKWGQDLISMGVDPEKSMQEFERTRAVSFDLMAMGRGHGESLAKTARSIEGKFGTDSNEYRMAQKALTDWDKRSKAMQTEWHKIGMAQQGETDIDTGSFTGISRAFKDATGQDFTPGQKQRATKISAEVSSADKAAQAAKPNLQATIDKIGAPVEPRVQRLAEKIIAAMDKKANDALARIKARQAQGRAFSVGDPEDFDDVIIYGAAKITKGVVEFGVWSHEMLAEIGKGIEPHLRKIFDAATKYEDDETTRLAGGKSQQQKVKSASKTPKVPTDIAEQKKAFQDYKPGAPMNPGQLKTLWTRAMEYIKPDSNDMADVVYKTSEDLGISAKDVLKGLNQSRSVKRVADDVWKKQRQARILKQSAKRWIETAHDTWLQKALPASARALFSAKVGLHGTVALGTHASLTAATHPIIFAQNFGKMYKLVASPEYYQMQGKAIARRPNYNVAQRAGLVNDMAKMEDFNDPRLALQHPKLSAWFKKNLDKVHLGRLVGMGTRGYSVLKVLRQDLFDHEWDKLAESKQTPDMAKAIADSVNHITGVDAAKLPSVANYALFAPKLALSRIKVVAGDPLRAVNSLLKMRDMTDAEKWFATNQFKEKAKIFGTATGLLIANQQLNSLFGDDKKLNGVPAALGGAGFNPMASDFMKFRVAGMNVAWGSPFLTMSRLPLRLVQIGMSNGGKSRFLIYPDESMYKTAGSYLRTQESPFMSPIVSLLTKADWQDRPLPQIPGYGPPPPVPKRLAAQGIKPYTWLEFGSEILMPIPVEEGVNEMWHYGLGSTPEQKAAMRKSFAVTLLMAATGGRIAEDWSKPAAPASAPPWESFR